jgi:Na+:H+ antiporter, NhaA family
MGIDRSRLAPHWSTTRIARLLGPAQEFVHRSASSGIVLIVATLVALVLANSGLAPMYTAVLDAHIRIAVGPWAVDESVLHWINDGLMAVFFFLVGLEIKREILVGELANPRAAMLPIAAAIGGALVPALIYVLFNGGGAGSRGWGVPMATDIAFALGCLALLGSRIPFGLKIFLTAVAIVDDLLAILVIAFFYSGGINVAALGVGFAMLGVLALANVFGVRAMSVYIACGVVVWLAFLESGIHATIAGVLVALTIPARYRIDAPTFAVHAHHILHQFDPNDDPRTPMLTNERQVQAVLELEDLCEQVAAPLQRMLHWLHIPVQFGIMPLFALANAGVSLSGTSLGGATAPIALGVVVGLVVGKVVGLFGASWLVVRSGIGELPQGVVWRHIFGVSFLGGIGFTMSLFIASLAFLDADRLAAAKLSILVASVIAAVCGLGVLSRVAPSEAAEPEHAPSPQTAA